MNTINRAQEDRWRFQFSNYPNIDKAKDLDIFDNFVKSCAIPDFNLQEQFIDFRGSQLRYSSSRENTDMSPLIIEFFASENYENYMYVMEHMMEMKYGQNTATTKERDNVINSIDIFLLDSERRERARIYFTNCFPNNLNTLNLVQGSANELIFSVNFVYDEMGFVRL